MIERKNHSVAEEPVPFSFSVKSFHTALRLAQIMAILTVALGALVLVGWLFGIETLKTVLPGFVSMKANTALCFTFCGSGLLIGYLSRPRAWKKTCTTILSSLVIFISVVTLFEYLTGISFGLDQLIFRDVPSSFGTSNPGRMAPMTALGFLLFGSSLIFLARGPRGALTAHILALAGLFNALLALVGYLFEARVYISVYSVTQIALHTIFGFGLLGFAILCSRPKKGLMATLVANSPGGLVARGLIAPAIIAPPCLGWIAFQGLGRLYDAGFAA